MKASGKKLESALSDRFGDLRPRASVAEFASTGIQEVDSICGGLPRGAITEISGPPSSGRTSLVLACLARACAGQEICALVDTDDAFDPATAAAAGVDLDRLLWVRCGGKGEESLKSTDLLVQGGGFGLIVLDLGDVPSNEARKIQPSYWYRFRRGLENNPTTLIVISESPAVGSAAALSLELKPEKTEWSESGPALLNGVRVRVERRRQRYGSPERQQEHSIFEARTRYNR